MPEYRTGLDSIVDFLAEAVVHDEVLLHGSNARTIEVFEPVAEVFARDIEMFGYVF